MSQDGEAAAVPKQEGIISIIVKDQNGGEVMFKVKSHTKLGKVMDKYLEKKALQKDSVRFLFDGERVKEESTPAELEMEENDCIEVVQLQVGGQ